MLRFRFETFGLWYPQPLYRAAWWRPSIALGLHLALRARRYAAWLAQMRVVEQHGAVGWWASSLSPVAFAEWRTALDRVDRTGDVTAATPR
jgi:hypothetical protein